MRCTMDSIVSGSIGVDPAWTVRQLIDAATQIEHARPRPKPFGAEARPDADAPSIELTLNDTTARFTVPFPRIAHGSLNGRAREKSHLSFKETRAWPTCRTGLGRKRR